MARHLLDLGHTDVAFITPPLTRRQWQRSKRVEGLSASLKRRGKRIMCSSRRQMSPMTERSRGWIPEYAMGYELTMELLQEGHKFTAIAGQNDMMAIGAMMRCMK